MKMNKFFVFLLLGLFLLSFASAWTSDKFIKDEIKSIDTTTNYGKYLIEESKWYDPLKIWTKETTKEIELKKNTDTCSSDCLAEGTIILNKNNVLMENILWKRSFDNQETWVDWTGFTNWKVLVEENVDVYETSCIDLKPTTSKNGTNYTPQECSQVKTGTEKKWNTLDFKKEYKAGTYNYRIEGSKKGSSVLDWIIKTDGKLLNEWAVWGNISLGDEAEVILNAPADDSIQYTNQVTTNATANVTGGAALVNVTLYDNSTGSWGARNSSNTINYFSISTGYTLELTTSAETGYSGLKVTITGGNKTLVNATKKAGDNSQYFFVLDASKNPLANGIFVGNIATVNYNLVNGATYYFVGNGTSATRQYESVSFPKGDNGYFNVIGGIFNSADSTAQARTIDSVFLSNLNTNFSTQTFTNTYSAGDTILWNTQFCDSDGDCGFAVSNRTFSIDSSAPTVDLSYPTSLLDYGKLNGTLQLNFSATDDNLDSVWYDYNGTNVTIAGAVSGEYNLSNITLSTKKNVTIYANDTAGNLNSSVFSWDYKVFENSFTFNNETRAGDTEDFTLNITLYEGYDLSTSTFYYGNLTDTPSITSSGTTRILEIEDYEILGYTTDTNVSIYFTLILDDASEINTTEEVQLVQAIFLDNCSSYTYVLFNMSLFDEREKTSLLGDIEFNYNLLNKPSYSSINTINFSETNISYMDICSDINLTGQNFAQSIEIRYTSDGYASEFYHIQKADISPNITNIELYDLNSSHSTDFKITYQDNTFNFVEGAIIQLQRKYISEDVYEVVEAPLTSSEGTAVLHIDLDSVKYKVTIVKDGVLLDTFENLVFVCESELTGDCEQKLLGDIDPGNEQSYDTTRDFIYSVTESNGSVTVSYSIPSGAPAPVNIILTQTDVFGNETLCNKTVTSSAGSIECNYPTTIGDSYLDLEIYKSAEPIGFQSYIIPEESGLDLLNNNFFIVFILLLSLVGMAVTSPEWIVVNSIMTMVISGSLFLLNGLNFVVGLGGLLWLIIAGAILIFKLAKQEDK